MPSLIRQRAIVNDDWRLLDAAPADIDTRQAGTIVPLAYWLAHRDRLSPGLAMIGVELDGGDDPSLLRADIDRLALVAVRFASFGDGRPYSVARLLRERFGFSGELRAIGHVQRDQLAFMERCGFDAFVVRDGEDAAAALGAFDELSDGYQPVIGARDIVNRRIVAGTP